MITIKKNGKKNKKIHDDKNMSIKPDNYTDLYWRTIDTSPKDGKFVLLIGGRWSDDEVAGIKVGIARYDFKEDRWVVTETEGGFSVVVYYNPTHWMPLPGWLWE